LNAVISDTPVKGAPASSGRLPEIDNISPLKKLKKALQYLIFEIA
jgi:hypothetical protein